MINYFVASLSGIFKTFPFQILKKSTASSAVMAVIGILRTVILSRFRVSFTVYNNESPFSSILIKLSLFIIN